MKLREGNVFTGVYDSVHGGVPGPGEVTGTGGVSGLGGGQVPMGACSRRCLVPGGVWSQGGACSKGVHAPGVPGGDPPPDGYCCGGTHPTGMYSCFYYVLFATQLFSVVFVIKFKTFLSKGSWKGKNEYVA